MRNADAAPNSNAGIQINAVAISRSDAISRARRHRDSVIGRAGPAATATDSLRPGGSSVATRSTLRRSRCIASTYARRGSSPSS